jgi:putative spermidine/putrescine transport system ATP-binding protein
MSLELQQLSYHYPGSHHGLEDVSLSVARGELVAVIGPSGSGKSTLLKLISGLTQGHSGRILLNGRDLASVPVHQRNLGMVFQSYALFPHLSARDNIAYGLKLRGMAATERKARAEQLLELIGMAELADRSVTQLSGGQQQRVALARALVINPAALLLDEPLAALDASIRGHLRDQIRELQKRYQATTLLVTHDQEEALSMADKVAMLKDGRLLQCASPKDIYEHPASVAVAQFVGLSTIFAGKISALNEIDLGFVRLKANTTSRPVGAVVHALIRPEHVQVDPPEASLNRLMGTTSHQRFLGALTRFDFMAHGAPSPILVDASQIARHAIALPPERISLLAE